MAPKGALPAARGRTYDLKSAYRQFGISEESRNWLRLAVNDTDGGGPHFFGMNTLPFGAVSSVASFLRLSLAIWFIGFAALRLLWTTFYDDFSLVSASRLENSASWAAESLFELLGLMYAKEGKKFAPFSTTFQTLGVQINLESMQEGVVSVGHTDSRRKELPTDIAAILHAGRLSNKGAERLRGRMIFFDGFVFGRVAASCLRSLSRTEESSRRDESLDSKCRQSLMLLSEHVLTAGPVKIHDQVPEPMFVFTDGAFENGHGSIGALVMNHKGDVLSHFSWQCDSESDELLTRWSRNPIFELELLPIAVAYSVWSSMLANKPV
jgi:hypothetical protein